MMAIDIGAVQSRMLVVRNQQILLDRGHKLAALIGDNLSTESTKTTIELNLAVLKITHEVTRTKNRE